MIPMTIGEILKAVNGTWCGDSAVLNRYPERFATDSRDVKENSLFIAFRGAKTDGHRYIPNALASGACAVLCEEEKEGEPRIVVPDVLSALQEAAGYYRNTRSYPFIGVTGSVGKTTAKEMIYSVLSAHGPVFKTPGSLNGQIGIPLAMLSLPQQVDAAVIEMGISLPGEMRRIGRIVHPDIGIFMNIADAHLEALKTREGILREKCEMLSYSKGHTVIINGDDELLSAHDFGCRTVSFGLNPACDVWAEPPAAEGGATAQSTVLHCGERSVAVTIPAYGTYMVYAALAAAAAGFLLGLSDEEIRSGIACYETVGHRSRVIALKNGMTLIDDCYNANPSSNRAAIDSMMALPGRKVCLLGDMREMGERSPQLHKELGAYAEQRGVDIICTQGAEAQAIGEGVSQIPCMHFETKTDMLESLKELLQPGDVILVKASHGAAFEDVTNGILAMYSYL